MYHSFPSCFLQTWYISIYHVICCNMIIVSIAALCSISVFKDKTFIAVLQNMIDESMCESLDEHQKHLKVVLLLQLKHFQTSLLKAQNADTEFAVIAAFCDTTKNVIFVLSVFARLFTYCWKSNKDGYTTCKVYINFTQ